MVEFMNSEVNTSVDQCFLNDLTMKMITVGRTKCYLNKSCINNSKVIDYTCINHLSMIITKTM